MKGDARGPRTSRIALFHPLRPSTPLSLNPTSLLFPQQTSQNHPLHVLRFTIHSRREMKPHRSVAFPCSVPFPCPARNENLSALSVYRSYMYDSGETRNTCSAAAGTFLVEFGALSRLTGDPSFEAAARRAVGALWERRSPLGLVGGGVKGTTGQWESRTASIGAGTDRYG